MSKKNSDIRIPPTMSPVYLESIVSRVRRVCLTSTLQESGKAHITTVPIELTQWRNDGRDAHRAVVCVLIALTVLDFLVLWMTFDVSFRKCMMGSQSTTVTFGNRISSSTSTPRTGSSLTRPTLPTNPHTQRPTCPLHASPPSHPR